MSSHWFIAPHSSASTWPKEPSQAFRRQQARHCRVDQREHAAMPAMEQQRFLTQQQELVERETGRRGDFRHKCGQSVDACRDFVDRGFHCIASLGPVEGLAPARGHGKSGRTGCCKV
jgi:hypothetical protein